MGACFEKMDEELMPRVAEETWRQGRECCQ